MGNTRRPRTAIDISMLDRFSLNAGRYRYAVDLIRGLAALDAGMQFLILGSRPGPPAELASTLDDAGDRVRYRPLEPASGRGSYYRDLWRYGRWLRANRVDLYHQLMQYLPPFKPCRYVITNYDAIVEREVDRRLLHSRPYRYYRWSIRHLADHVITISEASRSDTAHYYRVPAERITVTPLAVSPSFSTETGAGAAASYSPFILAPFSLHPYKNLTGLLRALPAVLAARPDLRLLLYGRAGIWEDREERFEAECRALGIAHAVTRLGFVPDEQLRALYATAELFVFPTLLEGFGYPLLEAMACGACCVATDNSVMEEVGGDAVRYTDTRQPPVFAAAMLELLADGARRRSLADAGRRRAAGFTIERMAQQTLDCYRRVIG